MSERRADRPPIRDSVVPERTGDPDATVPPSRLAHALTWRRVLTVALALGLATFTATRVPDDAAPRAMPALGLAGFPIRPSTFASRSGRHARPPPGCALPVTSDVPRGRARRCQLSDVIGAASLGLPQHGVG